MTQSSQNPAHQGRTLLNSFPRAERPVTRPGALEMPLSVRIHAIDPSMTTLHDIVVRRPESHLALVVLFDAIVCFKRYAWSTCEPERHRFREAHRWLSGDVPNSGRFTCGFICDALGIDRAAVTEPLLAWHTHESILRSRRPFEP